MGIVPTPESDRARFWAKVTKEETERVAGLGPCWVWTAAFFHNGYGGFKLDARMRRAHAISFKWHIGPTNGLQVCHHCDVRACVNPAHLFLGTQKDNIQDAVSKGRMATGTRNGMHVTGRTTLTESDVREIFALADGGAPQQALADQYGVTQTMISHITTGKVWQHLGLVPIQPTRRHRPTDDTVRAIRAMADDGIPYPKIAKTYGCSITAVWRIATRAAYQDIE